MRSLVYLHGFASSVHSTKATWLARRAADAGFGFRCPDLNLPDFETLTVTRMIRQLDEELAACPAGPLTVVGSSLGAVVALHGVDPRRAAAPSALSRVDSLVLLAPAIDIVGSFEREFGADAVARWRQRGSTDVFHYGDGRMRALGWGFFEDLRGYDTHAVTTPLPALIVQGEHDEAVDPRIVDAWARRQPRAVLTLVDDGHQLTRSLETIWSGMVGLLSGLS